MTQDLLVDSRTPAVECTSHEFCETSVVSVGTSSTLRSKLGRKEKLLSRVQGVHSLQLRDGVKAVVRVIT
jgi:hypothetical protein